MFNEFFPLSIRALIAKIQPDKFVRWGTDGDFLFMAVLCNRAGHIYFRPVSFFFLFSTPNLSGRRLDVYHTFTHGVALVRISNAGLRCAARGSLKIQDAKMTQKITMSAPSHNFVGLYLHK